MSAYDQSDASRDKGSSSILAAIGRWWWAPVVVIGVVAAVFLTPRGQADETLPVGSLVAAQRGPLSIRVASSGSIRSGDAVVLKNQVEGRTTILWIVEPEGTRVEEGDKLVELDSSALKDEQLEEEIEVETSRASFINAELLLEITKQQGQADIEAAEVQYRLALLDLEKYAGITREDYAKLQKVSGTQQRPVAKDSSVLARLNELAPKAARDASYRDEFKEILEQLQGQYKQEVKVALNNIILADAEARRARDRYESSVELHAKGFITDTELEADELQFQRTKLDQDVAVGELELLVQFTHRRTIEELLSAVSQTEFELEKARNTAQANIVDAEANMNARKERLVRDEQHLREINKQIEACVIRAPRAGMVVYGTTGQDLRDSQEPLAEGVEVRERQDLIRLPTTDSLMADLKIHESLLEKVKVGLPVHVTTDALPGRTFTGRISRIALLPDAQSRWLNPDLKVYETTVEMTGDTGDLRTGMSCRAEILVEDFENALYVPIQCVVRVGSESMVYVPTEGGGLQARPVEVGLDDNQVIQIVSGLEEGEMVSLTPPLREGQRPLTDDRPQRASDPAGSGSESS